MKINDFPSYQSRLNLARRGGGYSSVAQGFPLIA